MRRFFHPRGIVVIGVSPSPSNLAQRVILNLRRWNYSGKIVAIGRSESEVHGVMVHAGMDDAAVFDDCEMAVILTPARLVPNLVRRCGELGIERAIVETSGFSELHHDGSPLEEELRKAAQDSGVRIIGPNCVGLIQFGTGNVAAFATVESFDSLGDSAIISQSGGVGLCTLRSLAAHGVAPNWMVSIGNKLDVDEVELAQYLLEHEPVGRMLCYLESMPRGRAFCETISRSDVPVVVHKVNRTAAATKVAQSHTAALANDDAVLSAALEQAGAIRVRDTKEAVLAVSATRLPPIRGERVALVSRSGGHAVIATDTCAEQGLLLPDFSAELLADLEELQPASVILRNNPLDFGDVFDFPLMGRILERVCREDDIDAVVFVLVYNPVMEVEQGRALVLEAVEISRRTGKPISLAVVAEEHELHPLRSLVDFPIFGTPEEAVRAVGLLWHREQCRRRSSGELVSPSRDELAGLEATDYAHRVLSVAESLDLLKRVGLPVLELHHPQDASLPTFPLVAKCGPGTDEVLHKAGAGLVRRDIRDASELQQAVAELETRAREAGLNSSEIVVQSQLEGSELFLGARRDPSFGPVVLFGAGGSLVELLGDTNVWPYPFTKSEIERLWRRSKIGRIVDDRIEPIQLAEWLAGLGRLLEAFPEIEEIDVNPVIVGERGALTVDSRVVLVSRQTSVGS